MSGIETDASFLDSSPVLLSRPLIKTDTKTPEKAYSRLTLREHFAIFEMAKKGKCAAEIARALDRDDATVRDAMRRGQDALGALGSRWVGYWDRAAEVAAEDGNHKPAMEALLHGRQVDQLEQQASAGISVQVGIALPGMPSNQLSPQAQTLTVTALPVSHENT